ncbi:MAG: metalloregulator ArsR/SmtB family transcription factor, partial [Actinomycetota bacterium]|nr:metalloregulator ArsR/SmtB family transcription factor [Actinomycetota bacterium]
MLISTSIDKLAVFADPLRSEIITLLADEQLCTCHLVEMTGARQPTVSHHLKVLRDAGLVETEAVGRNTYYRLLPEMLEEYSSLLAVLAR